MGGLFWSAAADRTTNSEHPQLFGGTLVLEDNGRPLTVIDVATAKVTVRLNDVFSQVGGKNYADVQAVPVDGGTMLVNRNNGTFNLLGEDNYVLDPYGPGVGLGSTTTPVPAEGVGAGDKAYIIRSARQSTVSLVDAATVQAAAKIEAQIPGAGQSTSGHVVTAGPASAGAADEVTPPGFAQLPGQVALDAGSAVSAGADLWVLESTESGCELVQLQPVATGHNGLVSTNRLAVRAECQQAATEETAGQVALAEPGRVVVLPPPGAPAGTSPLQVPIAATVGDTQFLPVTGVREGFLFLAKSAAGWTLLSVTAAGHANLFHLPDLSPAVSPVAPVLSNGYLYTLEQVQSGQPTLWAIDATNGAMAPVATVGSYPEKRTETARFSNAQVLLDGPRVVFNNPGSLEAVVVFTDGSRPPVVIDKSNAIEVNATGPSDISGTPPSNRSATKGSRTSSSTVVPSKSVPVIQPVSAAVTCLETTQKPYAPQITNVTPSSGTALVTWSYELLDTTDCEPDSWSVTVTALGGAPQPKFPEVAENGQQQLLFQGLRPNTVYQVFVTAYINQQSTPSPTDTFTTSARGPDAPLSVTTTTDGAGNWVVSWVPCTEAVDANCVVPAATWTVIGAACGNSFVGIPPSVEVVAGATDQVTIDSDSLGLLGDSLSFSVQGALVSGLVGNPTSDGTCTESWRPPNQSEISLAAAGTVPAGGSTITANLQIETSAKPLEAFGSQNTDFVYSVGGHAVGPTTQTSVTIPGLAPGQQYTPSVVVSPVGHTGSSVTITGTPFTQDLAWPAGLGVQASGGADANNPDAGSLAVSFPGLPAGPMQASGGVTCGSQQGPVVLATPIVNGAINVPFPDLVNLGGSCNLTLTVADTATPNPYGVASSPLSTPFSIGTQPGYSFSSELSPFCQTNYCGPFSPNPVDLEVSLAGSPALPLAGGQWQFQSSDPDHSECDTQSQVYPTPPTFPFDFVMPSQCSNSEANDITVTVTYKYLGTINSASTGATGGSPVTTTTSTTVASTTTTTLPTSTTTSDSSSTTTVPCPTTTTSSTDCTSGNQPASVAAAPRRASVEARPDPTVRSTLAGALVGVPAIWLAFGAVRARRRVLSKRQSQKGSPR